VSATTLRTTAILKTDIASSTPRFRALAEADLAALLSEHRALLSRIAAAHDGHIVKPEGDGFWLAFPSVTAAALAAMTMQEELRLSQPNAGDDRLAMRIVIALGDVLHLEGALVGDAVVLATRIEALTPPDEIYVAEAAWLAMNRAEIRASRVDSFAVKGFAEPVTVYRIEQTHRTRVIADQYIVVTDLKGFASVIEAAPTTVSESLLDGLREAVTGACHDFGGVVRFNAGDAYCLTFSDIRAAMAGVERLLATWDAVVAKLGIRCAMLIAVHKGTLYAFRSYMHGRDLNATFAVERAASRVVSDPRGIFITSPVRRDLAATLWEARVEPLAIAAMPAQLEGIEIFRVRT
jgi:class 3 adenylate cyclase